MLLSRQEDALLKLETKILAKSSALKDGLNFMSLFAQSIAQDDFSKCFVPAPRSTILNYLMKGISAPASVFGLAIRYFVLFPLRLTFLLTASTAFFGLLPFILLSKNEFLKRLLFRLYCRAFLVSWGAQIKRHGVKEVLKSPHLFVSNHSSFIDFLVVSADSYPHATVAQRHNGLIGFFQKHILSLNGSLLFERGQKEDRAIISRQMRSHVSKPHNSSLLIFPEGTCVANEHTVLFHKGAFDMDCIVAPIAIKYDKSYGDAFWHTKTQTFTKHLFYLMTRWKLVAEVWYLPPRIRRFNQTATEFANEVKSEISDAAGLQNLSWDGYWKNFLPPIEKRERMKELPKMRYSAVLIKRLKARKAPVNNSRRFSITADGREDVVWEDTISKEEEQSTSETTSIRNQVLVALQNEERNGLLSIVKADVVKTWKKARSTNAEANLGNRRLENMTWRIWFSEDNRMKVRRKRKQKDLSMLTVFTNFIPFPSRMYSPQDLYNREPDEVDN